MRSREAWTNLKLWLVLSRRSLLGGHIVHVVDCAPVEGVVRFHLDMLAVVMMLAAAVVAVVVVGKG